MCRLSVPRIAAILPLIGLSFGCSDSGETGHKSGNSQDAMPASDAPTDGAGDASPHMDAGADVFISPEQKCLIFQSWNADKDACKKECLDPQCGDLIDKMNDICAGADVEGNCAQRCLKNGVPDTKCYCNCTAGNPGDCTSAYGRSYSCSIEKCSTHPKCNQ